MSGTAEARTEDVPNLDHQNGATLGRILGRGRVGRAEDGPDGKMTATIRILEDELVYDPGVLVLPHAGEVELTLITMTRTPIARCCRAMATLSSSGW